MHAGLERQLADYGAWLRTSYPDEFLEVAGSEDGGADQDVPAGSNRSTLAGRLVRIAAVLLIVIGLAGLVVSQRAIGPPATAADFASPVDPDTHLFVLPVDLGAARLTNADVSTARPDELGDPPVDISGVIVGIAEVGGGWSNLVGIQIAPMAPAFMDLDESVSISTSTGNATVIESRLPSRSVIQERGGIWIVVTGADETSELVEVLDEVRIDDVGSLVVGDGRRTVIDRYTETSDTVDFGTYFEWLDPASGQRFTVETATFPSASLLGVFASATLTPTIVGDTRAWLMTRESSPATVGDTALVWRQTPNRVVAVSAVGDAGVDEIRDVASQLRPVSEEEWLAALPGADIER